MSAPPDALNLLFFGIIRPYKGLEDLVRAFDLLDDEEVTRYWLTVVGETWEGWDLPIRLIQSSRHRTRITLVNRFVDDDEVIAHFAGADAVVLPYHRSSASSPAHVAMSNGLPLVITAVGGLPAAVADYEERSWFLRATPKPCETLFGDFPIYAVSDTRIPIRGTRPSGTLWGFDGAARKKALQILS